MYFAMHGIRKIQPREVSVLFIIYEEALSADK